MRPDSPEKAHQQGSFQRSRKDPRDPYSRDSKKGMTGALDDGRDSEKGMIGSLGICRNLQEFVGIPRNS